MNKYLKYICIISVLFLLIMGAVNSSSAENGTQMNIHDENNVTSNSLANAINEQWDRTTMSIENTSLNNDSFNMTIQIYSFKYLGSVYFSAYNHIGDELNVEIYKDNEYIDSMNVTVSYVYQYLVYDSAGGADVSLTNLENGQYKINCYYSGTDEFPSASCEQEFTITNGKVPTILFINAETINDNVTACLNLTDANKNPINGKNVTVRLLKDGEIVNSTNITTNEKGECNVSFIVSSSGTYKVEGNFTGEGRFNPSSGADEFIINEINTNLVITTKTEKNNVTIYLNLTDMNGNPINGKNVTVKLLKDGEIVNSTIVSTNEKGECNVSFSSLKNSNYKAEGNFTGASIYTASSDTEDFLIDVKKIVTNLNINVKSVNNTATIHLNLTDSNEIPINGMNVSIKLLNGSTILNSTNITTNEKGEGNVSFINLKNGYYKVECEFRGTDTHDASSDSKELIIDIEKIPTILNINVETVNGTAIISLNLTDINRKPINGKVKVNITSTNGYDNSTEIPIVNGEGNIILTDLSDGNYIVTGNFTGTDIYNASFYMNNFIIDIMEKIATNLTINVKIVDNTANIYLNLTDAYKNPISGNVTVNITSCNGYNNTKTFNLKQGYYTLALLNLNEGIYNVTAIYNGADDYESSFDNTNFEIQYIPTEYYLNASNVVKYFENGTHYHVSLTDNHGNHVANKTILVTLNCYRWTNLQYNITTNISGVATLPINLIAGFYNITATFENATPVTTNITVKPISYVLKATDVIKYFMNGTHYVVKVTDQSGNVIANKTVIMVVYSERWINPVTYNIKTNASGISILPIRLIPRIYSITATVESTTIYNNIVVFPTLTAYNIVKKINQPANLTARIIDGQGNPIKGKIITFTVKAKTYNLTTNSEGVANLPINLGLGTWRFIINSDNDTTRATIEVTR